MSVRIHCPGCRATFTVADKLLGKKVRCKDCQEVFVADDEEAAEARPAVEDRLQSRPSPARAPASRRRADPDADEEDVPARRVKKPAPSRPGGLPLGLIIGGVAALVLLLAGGVAAVWYFAAKSPTPAAPVAAGPGPLQLPLAAQQPAQPLPGQPAQPPQPGVGPQVPPANPPGEVAPAPGGKALRYRWQGGPHVYTVRVEAEKDDSIEIHEGNCVVNVRQGAPRQPVPPEERKATGTAFVVNANGYLVTCAHVVADAVKIDVTLGGVNYPATVLAVEHDTDLAVLKINAQNLPTLTLANSDGAELAQPVWALGFPLVKALGDTIKVSGGRLSGINVKEGKKIFQTDASINGGNSGGPLTNEMGAVLGINSAKLVGEAISNVGFAVPSNEARRLLTAKGVAFVTDGPAGKLDGPAVVKRVSPAVGLVTVLLGDSIDPTTFKVTCRGHLGRRQQAKPGVILVPRPPTFGGASGNSEVEMDAAGHILNANGGNQLPFLLGDLGQLFVEPLPPDNRATWETNGTCTIQEGGSPVRPIVPRIPRPPRIGGIPRPPIGPPAVNPAAVRQARERTVYTRTAAAGDTVTIQKRYELNLDPAGNAHGLHLIIEGPLTFDVKDGLPRSVDFKATLTVIKGAERHRLPFSVTYKLLEGDAKERVLHPPPPPKVEPKQLTDADLTKLLADLRGADAGRRKAAVDTLTQALPTPARRAEVAKALEHILEEKDMWVRNGAVKALGIWGTADSAPALLKLLGHENVFTRHDTVAALGKLGDIRAAEPLAKLLLQFGERGGASQALQALGAKAEKAVLPYLKHEDWGVRMEVCKILKAIGTKESKAALEAATKDGNGLVANEARQAFDAVATRP